jgi:hypothetical protein
MMVMIPGKIIIIIIIIGTICGIDVHNIHIRYLYCIQSVRTESFHYAIVATIVASYIPIISSSKSSNICGL